MKIDRDVYERNKPFIERLILVVLVIGLAIGFIAGFVTCIIINP